MGLNANCYRHAVGAARWATLRPRHLPLLLSKCTVVYLPSSQRFLLCKSLFIQRTLHSIDYRYENLLLTFIFSITQQFDFLELCGYCIIAKMLQLKHTYFYN